MDGRILSQKIKNGQSEPSTFSLTAGKGHTNMIAVKKSPELDTLLS
jgi:hypothetical protein